MEEEKGSQGERLSQFILSEIGKGGPIPFSQFMEWCLYHPEYGYYRSERAKIGRDGDYYTSPCVHPLFGGMIAKQLSQMAEQMGGSTFDVVESGGGRGFLCEDVLQWTKKNSPVFYQRLHYHLIETAPPFLKEQKERLRQLKEQVGELSDPRIASYFQSMDITLQEGQRAEVNLNALDWMEKVARCLKRGWVSGSQDSSLNINSSWRWVSFKRWSPWKKRCLKWMDFSSGFH